MAVPGEHVSISVARIVFVIFVFTFTFKALYEACVLKQVKVIINRRCNITQL